MNLSLISYSQVIAGEVVAEKKFVCVCNSTCLSVTVSGQRAESSRDLALVQTLEVAAMPIAI